MREALVDRLLEIAFTDRVIVIGYDREAKEPIERVSSSECVKAIEMLQRYDLGMPAKSPALDLVVVAEHLRKVAQDSMDLAMAILGSRKDSMKPEDVRDFLKSCATKADGFLAAAQSIVAAKEAEQADGPPAIAPAPAQGQKGEPQALQLETQKEVESHD